MIKTGIYKIVNTINNKVYIGSATDILKRWRDHKWHLIHNIHHNSHLQSAWNKYSAKSFEFSIVLECKVKELLTKELEIILKYNAYNNDFGYNVNDPEHIFLNRKHSEKTKKLLSAQKIGTKNPMFGKCGSKHPRFNKKASIETRNKQSISRRGIPTNKQTFVKLKLEEVIEIRKLYYIDKISQPKLAIIYGVSYTAVNKIITRKTWAKT